MTDVNNPFEPFIKIREKLEEITTPMGLRLIGFSVIPGEDRLSPHAASAVFEIDFDMVMSTESERQEKDMFDDIVAAEKARDVQDKAVEAREKLKQMAEKLMSDPHKKEE